MKYRFYLKLIAILALIFALLVAKSFISGLVSERQYFRQQAYNAIEQSWPGEQTVAAPLLVLPYKLIYNRVETITDTSSQKVVSVVKEVVDYEKLIISPSQLTINTELKHDIRYRGIYGIPVYSSHIRLNGEFNSQAILDESQKYKDKTIQWGTPILTLAVQDQRGINSPGELKWQNQTLPFQPSAGLKDLEQGMHVKLPMPSTTEATKLVFSFELDLFGMKALKFAPLAQNAEIKASADWPHPSFIGTILPVSHDIQAQGFQATWRSSSFSFNTETIIADCETSSCANLLNASVGFELVQPVDIYQQAERCVKYAELFIVLTFTALILFELLKKLRIHPVQYTLVGMALLMFYLLLIAWSEQVAFKYAYGIGASACTLLLTCYFGAILKSVKLGLLLGVSLAVLYTVLYVILQSENNALLMGSLLTFALLSVLMLTTRHFDWYALTRQNEAIDDFDDDVKSERSC